MSNTWSTSYSVHTYELDRYQRASTHAICSYLIDTAGQHAHEIGFSIPQLLEQERSWFFSRFLIRMQEYPGWREKITVETWPSGSQKLLFVRDWRLFSEQRLIGQATSGWLMIDMLKPARGESVLDIGCGWGCTARFAAERYGARVVGITVSREQAALGRQVCAGLDVDIRLQDYRDIDGVFDRVLSLGMFEHVGYKNYRTFMRIVREHLAEDGLFLLHTIGGSRTVASTNPWTARYIFPNSVLPSARQLTAAIEGTFVLEDWQNLGADYDRTLMCWHRNFEDAWPALQSRYDERFHRMWRYFLLTSAGGFRARKTHVWQLVLSPTGVPGTYVAPR